MSFELIRRQSLIHIFANLAIAAIGLISMSFFAHILGAAVLGVYYLFLAYFETIIIFSDGGFKKATVKRISEGKEKDEFFSASAAMQLFFLVIILGLLFIIKTFTNHLNSTNLFWWLIIALVINLPLTIISAANYGLAKTGVTQISNLLNNVSRVIIQVSAILVGFQFAGLAGGFLFGIVVDTLINFRYFEMHFCRFTFFHLKYLFSFSFWTLLDNNWIVISNVAGVILVGYFLSPSDVGIFKVILQLVTLGMFVAFALKKVLYPVFSKWSKEGMNELISKRLTNATTYSLVLAIPFCIGGCIMADELLLFFFGEEFISGSVALFILLFVQVINIFSYLQMMVIYALDYPKYGFYVSIVSVVTNIGLCILLIPQFGINGAALAFLISVLISSLLSYSLLRKYIMVNIEKKSILHILISTAVMALFIVILKNLILVDNLFTLIILVVIGSVVYFMLLLRIDDNIRNELKEMTVELGFYWPNWL